MTLVGFVILALATWRMASLLARESGPFDAFLKIRKVCGIVHDDDKNVAMIPETFLAQAVSCVWCNSIYIGLFWTLMFVLLGDLSLYFALPFAFSAAAIIADKWTARV